MIFILRLFGKFYLSSIKKFVILLEKTVWSNSLREQWHKAIMQNKCSYNKAKLIKENSCSYGKFSSHLGGILARPSEILPRWAGLLLIWTHLYFYKSFLRKVRSHLGELACLTGPAHLHMNSPLEVFLIYHFALIYILDFFPYFIKCFRNMKKDSPHFMSIINRFIYFMSNSQ